MAEFHLQAPFMPWHGNSAGVLRILLAGNCLTITVGEAGKTPCGKIDYCFQVEKGIYQCHSVLISGAGKNIIKPHFLPVPGEKKKERQMA